MIDSRSCVDRVPGDILPAQALSEQTPTSTSSTAERIMDFSIPCIRLNILLIHYKPDPVCCNPSNIFQGDPFLTMHFLIHNNLHFSRLNSVYFWQFLSLLLKQKCASHFIVKPQMNKNNSDRKCWYIMLFWSDKALKSTVVNPTWHCPNGKPLEITSTA